MATTRKPEQVTRTIGPRMVSIVVPVFNEEESIEGFMAAMAPVVGEITELLGANGRVEILFVDDGSRDNTIEVIEHLMEFPAEVRLVKLSRNFGKDCALAAGLAQARGDAVIPMDVDLQDPPDLIPKMVSLWCDGAKVVNAVRCDRSSDTSFKRMSAEAFYRIYNRLADTPIEPNVGDFRLLDREAIDVINQMPERIRFMKGLMSWVGYAPKVVEYSRPERAAGETKWRLWPLWNFALDGITGSSTLPLRIWTYFGAFFGVTAIIYAVWVVVKTLIFGIDVPGYASLLVVTLTFGALNMIAVGILGEYVGRIAVEVRQRPLYIIESVRDVADGEIPS